MSKVTESDALQKPATSTSRKCYDWTRSPPPPYLTPFQKFTRNVDWSKSPLGPMESWPSQLRQLVLLITADPSPAILHWGDEMTIVYNEAYVPLVGQKHPTLQGQDPRIGFVEMWDTFDKIIKDGQETGQTHFAEKKLVLLQRYGFLEETYFSSKFIPVVGEDGSIVASYATVVEVTREVMFDRRMTTIRTLSEHIAWAKDIKDSWGLLLEGLKPNDKDIPLAVLYSVQRESLSPPSRSVDRSATCVLEGAVGLPDGHVLGPLRLDFERGSEGIAASMRRALDIDGVLLLQANDGSLPESLLQDIEWRGFGVPCKEAVICPITTGSKTLLGFVLIGLNPRRPYDSDYRDFIHLITKQVTSPHFSAMVLSEEVRRREDIAEQAAIENTKLTNQLHSRTKEFEQNEMMFSLFADRVPVGLAFIDTAGTILYANKAWYDFSGLPADAVQPMSWLDSVIPDDRHVLEEWWQKTRDEKDSGTFQVRSKKPFKDYNDRNGHMTASYTTGFCAAYPVLDDEGNVKSLMGLIMDISELKWTEDQVRIQARELEQSELKYRQFADHAPIGVCLIDSRGYMDFANDAWFEITAQPRKDKDSMSWLKTIHPEDVEKMRTFFTDLTACKGPLTVESRLKRSWSVDQQNEMATNSAWILASGYTELHHDGTFKNIVCWLTDISAQKAATRALKEKVDEALEMKRQQENFIDVGFHCLLQSHREPNFSKMISHEIRNPLSAVLHCSEEIIRSLSECSSAMTISSLEVPDLLLPQSPRLRMVEEILQNTVEAAQTITYCVQHQKRVVDDVLTLSKLDSDLLVISPIAVQPSRIVQEAQRIFEVELRTADIHLDVHEDRSLNQLNVDWVLLDPSRLLQILINLTTNAIKFTRGEATRHITIKIAASLTKPSETDNGTDFFPQWIGRSSNTLVLDETDKEHLYLSVSVTDTGRGLTQEEKKLLFHRFSQGSPKTHVKYGGSGLGLFISRQITEMLGGEIGVASERGVGSTFTFFVKTQRTSKPRRKSSSGASLPLSLQAIIGNHKDPLLEVFQPAPGLEKLSLSPSKAKPRDLKILIVEDNIVNQKVLCKLLRNRGFTVVVANHGGEALAALEKTQAWKRGGQERDFDIILMDMEMPIMDGLTCVTKIRTFEDEGLLEGHVPVVAVTANVRGEHVDAALRAGMDSVTTKPYGIDDLLAQIDQAYHGTQQTLVLR